MMDNIVDKLVWFITGVIGSHLGHFIYQTHYADKLPDMSLSESLAMVFEDMIQLIIRLLDTVLPLFIASRQLILIFFVLLVLMVLFFIGYKIFKSIKTSRVYDQKLKEAENIVAEAKTYAQETQEENKRIREKMLKELKEKQQQLNEEAEKKLSSYKKHIKTLKAEKLELKETNAGLMRRLKER